MDLQKLNALMSQQITLLGFELVHMETGRNGHDSFIRLYIDRLNYNSASGELITMEDCVFVNDSLVVWMDVELPSLRDDFIIEVSSPGIERPLVKFEHFRRFCGHICRIQTRIPIGSQRHFKGRIKEATEKTVVLEEDGKVKVIPLDEIRKAHLAPFDENSDARVGQNTKMVIAD